MFTGRVTQKVYLLYFKTFQKRVNVGLELIALNTEQQSFSKSITNSWNYKHFSGGAVRKWSASTSFLLFPYGGNRYASSLKIEFLRAETRLCSIQTVIAPSFWNGFSWFLFCCTQKNHSKNLDFFISLAVR